MIVEPFGESAFLVTLGGGIRPAVNARVQRLADAVRTDAQAGFAWDPPVPAFESVLVPFDLDRTDRPAAEQRLSDLIARAEESRRLPTADGPAVTIPVRYGGEAGPDLDWVAQRLDLTPEEVVRLHTSRPYRVYMLGFAPGYAYLGTLPPRLRLGRRASPRPVVAPGSIGIAGQQTGVYPASLPGGFHLIGRTDAVMWDPTRDPPQLLSPGRAVRFVAVS
ncbi:MAG TPA: 5-oxoprolinase subunit PxpB [Candidatus Sulfotelmatobacter sp.]|nr:5-oxoprolinase subunit PxpB [Candidatus Sulfotelmatobacter sp.]